MIRQDVQKLSGDSFIVDDSSTCRTLKIILTEMKPCQEQLCMCVIYSKHLAKFKKVIPEWKEILTVKNNFLKMMPQYEPLVKNEVNLKLLNSCPLSK